jgi:hypothetical protein
MATTREFQDMLNDYLANDLLKEEFVKRDYLLNKVEKDDGWIGGPLIVPFKAAGASSIAFGSLTAANDVAQDKFVRGQIASQKEAWGTMIFNHRDIMEHNKISEKNFLKLLPGTIEDFMDNMKNVVSTNLLIGAHFATATADGDASGNLTVDRPDRFQIGQKVSIDDGNDSPVTGYVLSINMNTKVVNFVTARGGATPVDLSTYTVSQVARVYNDGAQSNAFSDLRAALLSAANGGSSTLYGETKVTYPYLQAINVDGSGATAATLLRDIFDALTTIRQLGKGNPSDVVMSYKNFGAAIKVIEASKGAFNVSPGSQKASQYGWTEIEVGSVTKGGLKLVAVQEMDDDVIFFIDWRALKFHSNGFFQKRKSPDGTEYFEVRATTGYQYLIDVCLFGDLVVIRPSYCGVMYGVSI